MAHLVTPNLITKGDAVIIRYKDLEPQWHAPLAKEPGYLRWLIRWVGGAEPLGWNKEHGPVITPNASVGFMHLTSGNRQAGLHTHTVAEIYIILKGQLMGWDGEGDAHMAGPMDCVYIPEGVPHGVRAVGDEDVELIWVHDGVELRNASIRYLEGDELPKTDKKIGIVRFDNLEPNWQDERAKEPEFLHWLISYVGGPEGFINHNRGEAVVSEKCGIGLVVLLAGQKLVPYTRQDGETYVIMSGTAVINRGTGQGNEEVGRLDAIYFPAGNMNSIRNHGTESVYICFVHEVVQKENSARYEIIDHSIR